MTTPDHRPYLASGDLRTAEDVLAWLTDRKWTTPTTKEPQDVTLERAANDLFDRLDRERRQACRRVALGQWHRLSGLVRWARRARTVRGRDRRWDEVGVSVWHILRTFIAFRAAAEAPKGSRP